ncbi:hypothetical protein MUGA111182_02710 [Mucilaginibacter galii]|uniref:Lipoprotein n=1 Tax=Mucilaginibacter galii TaxID=2005073 RepID=A0A917J739_9SPHI|nr:hypothetical protein [Mucilaginibacter galii]GGI50303.1 hypothetical protein GCM10011425_15150 [Mucilaginibacter galii]
MRISGSYQSLVILLTGIMLMACHPSPDKKVEQPGVKNTAKPKVVNQEDEVVNLILNLPEVKRKSAQVEKDSQGKRHLETYVETPPTAKDPNYWVKVAEDNGNSLVAYYIFAVHGKTHQISMYDEVNDSLKPLSKWREETPANER